MAFAWRIAVAKASKATDTSKETSSKKNPRTPINMTTLPESAWLCMALFSMSFHMFPLWNVAIFRAWHRHPQRAAVGGAARTSTSRPRSPPVTPVMKCYKTQVFFPWVFHGFPWFSMVFHGFPWFCHGFAMVFHGFAMVFLRTLVTLGGCFRWFFRWFFWGPKRIPNRISSKRMICAHV